jgi:phosphopantothenoylcysteine synthetase/decarboxylase
MPSYGSETGNVLYLIVCACPPARDTAELTKLLQADGWDVCITATPHALDWIDTAELEALTGHPVRSRFRKPDDTDDVPLGDAVLVAPASFNTINQWAAGINDTLALGLLNEALGRDVPVWLVPWANEALTAHPAYAPNLARLAAAGVTILTADAADFASSVSRQIPSPKVLRSE